MSVGATKMPIIRPRLNAARASSARATGSIGRVNRCRTELEGTTGSPWGKSLQRGIFVNQWISVNHWPTSDFNIPRGLEIPKNDSGVACTRLTWYPWAQPKCRLFDLGSTRPAPLPHAQREALDGWIGAEPSSREQPGRSVEKAYSAIFL
jgi:hypothetical protein